jgi:hypothetical protein
MSVENRVTKGTWHIGARKTMPLDDEVTFVRFGQFYVKGSKRKISAAITAGV